MIKNFAYSDTPSTGKEWKNINEKINIEEVPNILYDDQNITNMIIRDLFTEDINRIYIDNKKLYNTIYSYTKDTSPKQIKSIEDSAN